MAARAGGRMARRLVVIGGIWTLLQVYVGARLLGRPGLGPVSLGFAWAGVLLLALAPFAALFAGRMQGVPFRAALEWTGFLAMGLSSLLIVFTLAADVLHAGSWVAPRVLSVSVLGGAVALTVAGTWRARERRVGPARAPAEERVRRACCGVRPPDLRPHARRPILPVQPAGAAVRAVRRGTAPARGNVAVREPGHGLLGAATPARRALRDHAHPAQAGDVGCV